MKVKYQSNRTSPTNFQSDDGQTALVEVDEMTEYAMAREGITLKDIQPM